MHTHQAEPRPDIGAPPPNAVDWRVSIRGRSVRVRAQLWLDARKEGALLLRALPHFCSCVRLDEKKLPGKAVA